jgi:L-rhamnose isomerase
MTSFVSSVLASARRTLAFALRARPTLACLERGRFFPLADVSARENDMDLYSERIYL